MHKNITTLIKNILTLIAVALLTSLNAAEIDTSKFEQQCKNLTTQQRQMAKAAGYDVDAACNSLDKLNQNSSGRKTEEKSTVLPRDSKLEMSQRGVIGEQTENGMESQGIRDSDENFSMGRSDLSDENNDQDDELKRYGYELFAGVPTTFSPASDIPIPVDYILGPRDNIQIQLLGKTNDSLELTVGRDGSINFPELGPIAVAGLKYTEAKKLIQDKVSQQMIGVRAVISLGELRSIKVFILGEAFKPGSYTVSSLSTMTNALFVSGGITDIGSLRNIQLKRQGKLITTLDLYDLLQKGDTQKDARLLPGDVIYIPPVGKTVGIKGEVKRPAIYELRNENSLSSLIKLAGGYSANAYPNISYITRRSQNGFTTVLDVDLTKTKARATRLKNGDIVEISTVLDTLDNVVELEGAFYRPRAVKWRKGLRLLDVIHSVKDFNDGVDLNLGLIIRREMPLRNITVQQFNLQALLNKNDEEQIAKNNLQLQPLDKVLTFDRESDRLEILAPYIELLREQNVKGGLPKIVEVAGNVRFPGEYPLTSNMNARDLILAAGGLREASYLGNAEITRRDMSDQEMASVGHVNINLANQLTTKESFKLQSKDKLTVYLTPEYREHMNIRLAGEVRFPGDYEFRQGETLSQVIYRAGGFTSTAHLKAAVFTRTDLRIQEAKQLQELKDRMREDIAASELEDAAAGKGSSLKDAEGLLDALSDTEALGRLVISLEDIVSNKIEDITLKDGDELYIPTFRQEISVIGEVQHGASHLFNSEWTVNEYIEKSGGVSNRADEDRIYVVKADGSVFLPNQSGWLTHQNELLNPGDTIVVPLDTERMKALTLWTSVSQIIYQLALGAAAVSRL